MKKLKLKLGDKAMLSKEQMKKVIGGYSGDCVVNCPDGHTITCHFDTGYCTTGANGTSCATFDGQTLSIKTCDGSSS